MAVQVGPWPGDTGPIELGPARALAITERGDRIEVRILDPDADPARYRQEFAAHGLNVDLRLKAASPSLVGRLYTVTVDGEHDERRIRRLGGERGCGRVWCKAGVSLPRDLRGRVVLGFGRPPAPGEDYELASPDATAPGEPLAGLEPRGRTVSEVVRIAGDRRVTISRFLAAPPSDPKARVESWHYDDHVLEPDQVPGGWYVQDVFTGRTPGTVELAVSPRPGR